MNITSFHKKIAGFENPVIVDLWAPWCGPCRVSKPILEKLADEFEGKVEFWAVNSDENQDVLREYKVMSIPTLLVFKDGKAVNRVVGLQSAGNYRRLFESLAKGESTPGTVLSNAERVLRLGIGLLLVGVAWQTTNWWLAGLGALVMFTGVYDRCPLWQMITARFKK